MKRTTGFCALVSLALLCSFLDADHSDAAEKEALIAKIQRSFDKTQTMSAKFVQTVTSKGFGQTEINSGRMYLLKPSMMRWEYDKPAGKLIVVNPDRIWLFDPLEEIAHYGNLRGVFSPNSPALFLAGRSTLDQLFKIDLVKPAKDGTPDTVRLRLIPKEPQAGVKAMALTLDRVSFAIVELVMVDYLGNKNKIKFSDALKNITLDKSLFTFKPPAGVAVQAMPELN